VVDKADLRARVERINHLPASADVVDRVRAVVQREHHSAADLAEEISRDQALAGRVLKVVNSGFFAFRQPIATITHAMVLLGTDVVKTLVVSAPVLELFGTARGLWRHSLATARAAGALASLLDYKDPEELGLAGLFHDVGKVVLANESPIAAREVRALVRSRDLLVVDAEEQILGFTHADVGSWLLQRWAIPQRLIAPVAHHHRFDPTREHADRTAIVHVGDILARARGIGDAGDTRLPGLNLEAWALLRLTMDHVRSVLQDLDSLEVEQG
jgi:putative nucleotidyltransferase with HDIG domain